ncbi:MAG: hypothetical protein ACREGB_03770 [Candidatus Saccharimonadales bacterium]
MKLALLVLIAVIIFAITAGIIVVHRQGTKACISYYSKDGSHALYKDCK